MNKTKNPLKQLIMFLSVFLVGAIIGGTAVFSYSFLKKREKSSIPNLVSFGKYQDEAAAYIKFKEIKKAFISSGIPKVYGQELNISFDQVQKAINKTRVFDPSYGVKGKKIALSDLNETELKQYKEIGSAIACQYCCGVKSLVKKDGTAACGCAHSAMMRGLAAYLIKNHSQEFNNKQILKELIKWQIAFFPKQTLSAELAKKAKAGEPGIEKILKEFPDFLPKMVGGC